MQTCENKKIHAASRRSRDGIAEIWLPSNAIRAADQSKRERLRTARRDPKKICVKKLFIPCVFSKTLLEAVPVLVKSAVRGDVILYSSACSSFDQLRVSQHRGEVFPRDFDGLAATIRRGSIDEHPNMQTSDGTASLTKSEKPKKFRFAPGFFEEKPRRESNKNTNHKHDLTKGRLSAPPTL
ncbi:MAG TPA: hypothetical protein VN281_07840 [Verrucomicrobiae bacterium]|jgi:hypothetical protein|nr:hypothetical protein [Verrucomicrobiae bacterium]